MNEKSVRSNTPEPIVNTISYKLKELEDLWTKIIGYDEKKFSEINVKLITDMSDICDNYMMKAEHKIQEITEQINALIEQIVFLNENLYNEENPDIPVSEEMPLIQKREKLREILEPLEAERIERILALNQIQDEESMLLNILGREKRFSIYSTIPTEQELCDFKQYILNLEQEISARRKEIGTLQIDITDLLEELGIDQMLDFTLNDVADIELTDRYLAKLKEMLSALMGKKCEHEKLRAKLMGKLIKLWSRIEVTADEKETFLDKYRDHRKSTLDAIEKEIERCEELKKLHMCKYIQKLRNELTDLWDLCKVSDEEKSKFTLFHSRIYNDNVAIEHEDLVEYYKNFYYENRKIFDLLEERLQCYNEYIKLENSANNSDRLFHNRGGKLLQEEKNRKKIMTTLPKLDKELLGLLKRYECTHNKPFRYFGSPLEDLLKEMNISKKKKTAKENMAPLCGNRVLRPFPRSKLAETPYVSKTAIKLAPNGPGPLSKIPRSAPAPTYAARHVLSRRNILDAVQMQNSETDGIIPINFSKNNSSTKKRNN